MAKHAVLSPSGAAKWSACPGAPRMESLAPPERASEYAAEGTAMHFLASEVIELGVRPWRIPEEWKGQLGDLTDRTIAVADGVAYWSFYDQPPAFPKTANLDGVYLIDDEMVENVRACLDQLEDFCGDDGIVFSEQLLDISMITGEEGACGTADAIVLRGTELQVHDWKFGRKAVDAALNPQLIIYAGAALDAYSMFHEIDKVTVVIHQPRLGSFPSHSYTVSELSSHIARLSMSAAAATVALNAPEEEVIQHLYPGDHCREGYCKARAYCPKLAEEVQTVVEASEVAGVSVITCNAVLGEFAKKVPMIEDWCEQINVRVNAEVLAGSIVPGYKAVMGREGNRKWQDETEVEALLKGMKIPIDTVYAKKLNSPTVLEKAAKAGAIGPKQWPKVSAFITREPARAIAVPVTDKRPAVTINLATDDFDDIS